RPASHLKPGKPIYFGEHDELVGKVEKKHKTGHVLISFRPGKEEEMAGSIPEQDAWFWENLNRLGETPLPPYIERPQGPDEEDRQRYQTVFAQALGAVAAPTAGLHFTDELFARLEERGVEVTDLVLHVGPGTFRPIKTERITEHKMDVEFYDIPPGTVEKIAQTRSRGGRVIAIGTTVTRALESAADEAGKLQAGDGSSDLFIRPPYKFRVIDGLVTNFHLPRSTLLMLVSSFTGRARLLAAYQEAIAKGYRFYSYGDAMLVLP
ncbi:MAG: tRNA preQ1(34) S-adenosylmethionine ribosyltransferase-isomerase QueA, partial [Planctomycetes bacterium]|nr:tRNA preQ1(34) S-adenosylmethionine ribosyltransferase-isomerase QueA [Planctomycetota bacterium]